MEPLERVAVLLTLMRELEAVMRLENGMLREMKLARMAELQSEKSALARAYEVELRVLRAAPDAVASLPDGVRAGLEQASRDFQASVRVNLQVLGAAKSVVEGIVRHIGDSLASAGRSRPGYAAPSRSSPDPVSGRVIAVAFDRRI